MKDIIQQAEFDWQRQNLEQQQLRGSADQQIRFNAEQQLPRYPADLQQMRCGVDQQVRCGMEPPRMHEHCHQNADEQCSCNSKPAPNFPLSLPNIQSPEMFQQELSNANLNSNFLQRNSCQVQQTLITDRSRGYFNDQVNNHQKYFPDQLSNQQRPTEMFGNNPLHMPNASYFQTNELERALWEERQRQEQMFNNNRSCCYY